MAILVARSSVADELVYSPTKAVFDNLPQFQSSHPAARHLTLHTALSGMALPLHPGAERYFQQSGIARIDALAGGWLIPGHPGRK
jgi:TRAP-type uncharacterized transport system substrate-binding protein